MRIPCIFEFPAVLGVVVLTSATFFAETNRIGSISYFVISNRFFAKSKWPTPTYGTVYNLKMCIRTCDLLRLACQASIADAKLFFPSRRSASTALSHSAHSVHFNLEESVFTLKNPRIAFLLPFDC